MKKLSIILGLMVAANASFAAPKMSVEQLRKQAHLAKLDCNAALMEMRYAQILKIKPQDENAAFNVALARSWQPEKMAQASADFEIFTKQHPNNKDAWIAYANLENWRQHLDKAFTLLENYKARFGNTEEYRRTYARLLANSGHYSQALALNTPLLSENPRDYDLMHTQTRALLKSNRFKEARRQLRLLEQLECKNNDTKDLENDFLILSESPLTASVNYYFDNQGLKNLMFPVSLDWTLNDNTQILFRGLHEILKTDHRSGLYTIKNHDSTYDDSLMAGIRWRMVPTMAVTAMAGDLKIENLHDKFIYLINLNFALDDNITLNLSNHKNLYRPYLYPTSPKAVSLGITENQTAADLAWQPWLNASMNILARYSILSDDNHITYVNLTPSRQFILNSKITAILGADAEFLIFTDQPHHGYYAPKFHQQYLITGGLMYSPTACLSTSISAGVGTHEDDIGGKFEPAATGYANLTYSVRPFEFNLSFDYTYQDAGHKFRGYQGYSTEASIVMRF